jgi:hypothetical protein
MDTHSLRRYLNSIWPLVYAATRRKLSRDERAELQTLVELMERGVSGRDSLGLRAEALCLALYSSGLFEMDRTPACLDALLREIDWLRNAPALLSFN